VRPADAITGSPSGLVGAALTASCVDPEEIPFRLWQSIGRQGVQVANTPGAWNFSDLYTTEPSASKAFYGGLLGWIFEDVGYATMIRQPGYGDHLAGTRTPGFTSDSLATRCRPVSPMPLVG
jgi:hypothetical protein